MTFLLRYRRILAIAAGIAMLLSVLVNYHRAAVHKAEQRGYERAQSEYAVSVARANADQAARDSAARKAFQTKESAWTGERIALQNQIAHIAAKPPVVRLCRAPADHRELPGAVAAAGSADGTGQQRIDDLPVGGDIGPAVTGLLAECESYRLRLLDLQPRWPAPH